MREWAEGVLEELNPEALFFDGLDEAIIGVTVGQAGMAALVVYDEDAIIRILMEDGIDHDGAWEYYGSNVSGAYVGPHTPLIISRPWSVDGGPPGSPAELER